MTKFKSESGADQQQEQDATGQWLGATSVMHVIDCRVGAALKQARLSAGLEPRQLAERCSVSEIDVVRYEDGALRPPARTLLAISRALDTSVSELFRAAA